MKSILYAAIAAAIVTIPATHALAESERDMALEIKAGPYYPSKIDRESGLTSRPFDNTFGTGTNVLTEAEFDYEIWQGYGTLAAGASLGFVQWVGEGFFTGTQEKSQDKTVFNLIPTTISGIYRWDWLAVKHDFPLVPFIKLGFDYYVWWVLDSNGNIAEGSSGNRAAGGKFGYHARPGIQFLLDFLAPGMAADFDQSSGVNNSYVFIEGNFSRVNSFSGDGFDFSSNNFMIGLMLEM